MKRKTGRLKYQVSSKHRKHLVVDAGEHALVMAFAAKERITLIEATHYLLGLAFAELYHLPKRKPRWWFGQSSG